MSYFLAAKNSHPKLFDCIKDFLESEKKYEDTMLAFEKSDPSKFEAEIKSMFMESYEDMVDDEAEKLFLVRIVDNPTDPNLINLVACKDEATAFQNALRAEYLYNYRHREFFVLHTNLAQKAEEDYMKLFLELKPGEMPTMNFLFRWSMVRHRYIQYVCGGKGYYAMIQLMHIAKPGTLCNDAEGNVPPLRVMGITGKYDTEYFQDMNNKRLRRTLQNAETKLRGLKREQQEVETTVREIKSVLEG